MGFYLGIDLGSTTSKAVVLDEDEQIVGRGLTNTRSNYEVAASLAQEEALVNARFYYLRRELEKSESGAPGCEQLFQQLESDFRLEQHLFRVNRLHETCLEALENSSALHLLSSARSALDAIFTECREEAVRDFDLHQADRSRFFRDIIGSQYMALAEKHSTRTLPYDFLLNIYDRSILKEENRSVGFTFESALGAARNRTAAHFPQHASLLQTVASRVLERPLEVLACVGTGYGRQRLPFPKEQIRSEILCHGLGAHYFFPATRTVLDIGGQDTKAIQVDDEGVVTSFQMNDRCAAGCGRYLGYIADELNIGLHELGPLAMQSRRSVRITSTCTVFAGAELRDRLSLGDSREDILAGLHRAITLRAMSLLSRSGGVFNEFTFTGGVAKNSAAVKALSQLIAENYGERKLNIHPDSIYTGAVGAALYARRASSDRKAA
ncbi:MAG: benzoyl-CoA reductase subunit A [Acidobacteria bacterium]|nr:benzoyl-CoA reductase subunit A [Acidobacteriota bacterium]